jgi:hypothetical protein
MTKSIDSPEPSSKGLLPSDYMRQRRPNLFSDSNSARVSTLTREVLGHHLSTITGLNDENTFEFFARKLAEATICPNLLPNTGPSGGGDAKADTETYPVSEEVALRWYHGEQAAAQERWAFAISAKKEWPSKIKSDVKGIIDTKRDYKRIYFITNQPVKSKARAGTEDKLLSQYGVKITILDINWILEQVFDKRLTGLAVKALGLSSEFERHTQVLGAEDFKRALELEKLDAQISNASRYSGIPHALADDILDATLLARGLGKSRQEIDGRFVASRRAAIKAQNRVLEFKIVYHWAWTAYFWFNDFEAHSSLYGEAAALVENNQDAAILAKLGNLWPLLRMSVFHKRVSPELAKIEERGLFLKGALSSIAANDARPNNALHAKCALLLVEFIDRRAENPEELDFDYIWERFRTLIQESRKCGTFPFNQITDALREIGKIANSEIYDCLVEEIASELGRRRLEGESARVSVEHGYQKLERQKPYEAIRWFGRAIDSLLKKEYEHELFLALAGLAEAYDKVGLPWAARSCALAVVSHQITENYKQGGGLEGVSASLLNALFCTELQLGRIAQAVAFHSMEMAVRRNRVRTESEEADLEVCRKNNALMVGSLLLGTKLNQLCELERLPDLLDNFGLTEAAVATLFILGQMDKLREDHWVPSDVPNSEIEETMNYLREERHSFNFFEEIQIENCQRRTMRARLLGAELSFDTSPELHSVTIAEALLGASESFLATSLRSKAFPVTEQLLIRVDVDDNHTGPPALQFTEEAGTTVGYITHSRDFGASSRAALIGFNEFCRDAVVSIIGHVVMPIDSVLFFEEIEKNMALSRALTFCHVPVMTENIFESSEPVSMQALDRPEYMTYPNLRIEEWQQSEFNTEQVSLGLGQSGTLPELKDDEQYSHRDHHVRSPIDIAKWNTANWSGTVFLTGEQIPVLGLAFKNEEAAVAIFEGLRSRYGEIDTRGEVRVAIVRGVTKDNPNAYAVYISTNVSLDGNFGTNGLITYVAKFNHMFPQSSVNLDRFLAAYSEIGKCVLEPFHFPFKSSTPRRIGVSFELKEVAVIDAWQIGENDPEIAVLLDDSLPYIPEGVSHPPVLAAIAKKKQHWERWH